MLYKDYLKSEDWRVKRRNKHIKSKGRCGICASKNNIDIHHINYKNLINVETSDLRLLCRRCHFLAHDLMKEGKIRFRNTSHHSRFAILKHAVKKHLGIANENMFNHYS